MTKCFESKRILVTGGTGSLGKVLVRRLLSGEEGLPKKIIVFSRDEAKQHFMRLDYQHNASATDEVIYNNFRQVRVPHWRRARLLFPRRVLRDVDIVFNAAALKQVPTCEYFPFEAVLTNIAGPENIVRAIQTQKLPVETVIGISTDKACKPVNAMGMTKALQERLFIQANMRCETRVCLRPLRKRSRLAGFGHPALSSTDPRRRAGDYHLAADDAVFAYPGRRGGHDFYRGP